MYATVRSTSTSQYGTTVSSCFEEMVAGDPHERIRCGNLRRSKSSARLGRESICAAATSHDGWPTSSATMHSRTSFRAMSKSTTNQVQGMSWVGSLPLSGRGMSLPRRMTPDWPRRSARPLSTQAGGEHVAFSRWEYGPLCRIRASSTPRVSSDRAVPLRGFPDRNIRQ